METIRNAANVAASYVGLDQNTTTEADKVQAGDTLGELVQDRSATGTTHGGAAPQNTHSTSGYSGVEPVSGQLGSGTAGQPYDAGNSETLDSNRSSGLTGSGLTGSGSHTTGSGLTGSGNSNTTSGGIGSTLANLTGYGGQNTTTSQGTNNTGSGLTGTGNSSTTSGGLTGALASLTGYGGQNTTTSNSNGAGYESTSGHGNNTGYQDSTSRGLGAESSHQANHYTSTAEAGKLPSATGLGATRRVDDGTSHHTTGLTGNHGHDSHNTSAGFHSHGLGSDRSAGHSSDRYLFDARNAPGAGGRHSKIVDDYTDSNIHNEGSGTSIDGALGSDANSGRAGIGAAGAGLGSGYTGPGHHDHTSHSTTSSTGPTTGTGLSSRSNERSRKPGFERMGSGLSLGNSSHGLNSGAPRESIGTKLERKGEEAAVGAAAATGVGAATHSGREPVSRDTGITGQPHSSRHDQDRQVNQATSGVGHLNLHDRQADNAYPTSQTSYGSGDNIDPSKSNSGLNLVGLAGRQTGTSDRQTGTHDSGLTGTRDRQADSTYPTSQTSYASGDNIDASKSNSGLNLVGLSNRQTGTHGDGLTGTHDRGLTGTQDHNTTGSSAPGFHGYTGPNSTNEQRLAEHGRDFGATAPRNESDIPGSRPVADECAENHHNAHPIGEGAHVDGTHKPTFLNYQHDKFGVPVARGD